MELRGKNQKLVQVTDLCITNPKHVHLILELGEKDLKHKSRTLNWQGTR